MPHKRSKKGKDQSGQSGACAAEDLKTEVAKLLLLVAKLEDENRQLRDENRRLRDDRKQPAINDGKASDPAAAAASLLERLRKELSEAVQIKAPLSQNVAYDEDGDLSPVSGAIDEPDADPDADDTTDDAGH